MTTKKKTFLKGYLSNQMLFETLFQPKIFFFLMLIGFASGFVFDVCGYFVFLCKNNKIVKIIFDFFGATIIFAIFYASVLMLDYGDFRLYHFLTFATFLLLQRYTLGKLIAKLLDTCYNAFVKIFEKLSKGLQKIKWKKTNHNNN